MSKDALKSGHSLQTSSSFSFGNRVSSCLMSLRSVRGRSIASLRLSVEGWINFGWLLPNPAGAEACRYGCWLSEQIK
jgi:hypothetical protein